MKMDDEDKKELMMFVLKCLIASAFTVFVWWIIFYEPPKIQL